MTALFFSCLSFVFFFFPARLTIFLFPPFYASCQRKKKGYTQKLPLQRFFFVFNVHVCFILSCIAYVVMLPFHLFSFATFIIIQRIAARTITHVHTHTHSLYRFSCHRGMLGLSLPFFLCCQRNKATTPPFFLFPSISPFFFFVYAQLCLETMHTRIQTIKKRYIYIYIMETY